MDFANREDLYWWICICFCFSRFAWFLQKTLKIPIHAKLRHYIIDAIHIAEIPREQTMFFNLHTPYLTKLSSFHTQILSVNQASIHLNLYTFYQKNAIMEWEKKWLDTMWSITVFWICLISDKHESTLYRICFFIMTAT